MTVIHVNFGNRRPKEKRFAVGIGVFRDGVKPNVEFYVYALGSERPRFAVARYPSRAETDLHCNILNGEQPA